MEVDIMCHNIMIKITFFVAFCICIFQGSSEEKAVCSEKESPIKCCANYKLRGKDCIPCYGYSGPQCARSCLPGYCGFGCKNECLCEQCFPVNCSCFYDQESDGSHSSESFDIIVLVVVVIGICFVTAMIITGYVIRCRTSRNKEKDKDSQLTFRTMGPPISLHDFERASDNPCRTKRQRLDPGEKAQEVKSNTHGYNQISMMYKNQDIMFENDDPMFEYDLSLHIE